MGGGLGATSLGCNVRFNMNVSKEEFYSFINPFLGIKVTNVWRGFGSALFLELGKLTKRSFALKDGSRKEYYEGKHTIFIGFGWRVERIASIYFGSWSTNKIIDNRFSKLNNKSILELDFEGRLPELRLKLSDGLWIHSFSTSEGQPEWYIRLNNEKPTRDLLHIKRGNIINEIV
jgi:hypothetical protein